MQCRHVPNIFYATSCINELCERSSEAQSSYICFNLQGVMEVNGWLASREQKCKVPSAKRGSQIVRFGASMCTWRV